MAETRVLMLLSQCGGGTISRTLVMLSQPDSEQGERDARESQFLIPRLLRVSTK